MNPSPLPAELYGVPFPELEAYVGRLGEPVYRAAQIFTWIYQKGVTDISLMKNLSRGLRESLARDFTLGPPAQAGQQKSADGTVKILFALRDGETIESVLIPAGSRRTICLSSQAGCKFGCRFCASGLGGWKRNLTAGEIIGQVMALKALGPVTHVVFMGVGEPLDNYDQVLTAVRLINDPRALNIGARRITISTCGVVPGIRQLAREDLQFELAVSLHGYDDASRGQLMPVNRTYPFDELIKTCRHYADVTNRQITFEYLLIKDLTCTDQAAAALRKAFQGLLCKMNLIPYNEVAEFPFRAPSAAEIASFRRALEHAGIHATLRASRGRDIDGACGQLRRRTGEKISPGG